LGLSDEVTSGIDGVLDPEWNTRKGRIVPEATEIALRNGAVELDATYLYADMANSTGLAQNYKRFAVAKVVRCYLNAASRLIRARGGAIRSFDGDRVMGIFVGATRNDDAARAAMNVSWAVTKVIQPKLEAKWKDFHWKMGHGIGIDTGEAMLVRGGVFGDNDLVSIGSAPNVAAKLSEERSYPDIYATETVYKDLSDSLKYWNGKNMWSRQGTKTYGGKSYSYYGSAYWWKP
jgi:uridylate cyclase